MLKNICKILAIGLDSQLANPKIRSLALSGINTYRFASLRLQQPVSLNLENFVKSQSTIKKLQGKGIEEFFPIQAHTYDHIFQGKDVIAGDKTGSGKTIAFTLPIIERMRQHDSFKTHKGIKFVVLAPTRELAVQISNEIGSLKQSNGEYKILTVFGGTPVNFNIKELSRFPDILVGTPGRICDLIDRGVIDFKNVQSVCIDEADFMFDIGFKQSIKEILRKISKSALKKCQYLCFSATLNNEVSQITEQFMDSNKVTIKMYNQKQKKIPSTIEHKYVITSNETKVETTQNLINTLSNGGRVIIFTNTKKQSNFLSENLGIENVCLNGDVEQAVRFRRLDKFKRGDVQVLVATDVAARGLDIPNVELVIHYDHAAYLEGYVHRSGRTGRAGKDGLSVILIQNQSGVNFSIKKLQKQLKIRFTKIVPNLHISRQSPPTPSSQQQPSAEHEQLSQKQPDRPDKIFSDTQFVLFDNKDRITAEEVKKYLKECQISYGGFLEVVNSKLGIKFYKVRVEDQNDQIKLMNATFQKISSRFKRHKLPQRQLRSA